MINPFLPNVDGENKKSQSETLINPFLPSKSSLSTSSTTGVNPFLPSQGGDVGGYAGPEGGRTPLNVLAAMPGTAEGIIKGGLAFGIATPYATVRATFNAAVQGEIDAYPKEFERILHETTSGVSLFGIKPFEAQTEAGQRFLHMLDEKVIRPISDHFKTKADLVFEATNSPALATAVRTAGELVGLLTPIVGVKGAAKLTSSIVDKIPAKPINIPGTEVGLPLGRKYYEDPRNLITFKEFDAEFRNTIPKGETYNEQASKDMYAEFNRKVKEAKEEGVREEDVEIIKEDTPVQASAAEKTIDPGIFLSSFSGLINPRTNKPYTDSVIKRRFTKHVNDFNRPPPNKIGEYQKQPKREYRMGTAKTYQEALQKDAATKEMNRLVEQRKREGKTLDEGITQEIATKILEVAQKAVYSPASKKIYSDLKKGAGQAEAKALAKGEIEYVHGISAKGVVSKGAKFFSNYEVLQLMEKAETNKIVLESEFAKKLKVEDSILKDPELTPESIKEMTSGRFDKRQADQEVQKTIAKGPKEVKALSPKETMEASPTDKLIFDYTQRMWEREGGWQGKARSFGQDILPDNYGELLKDITKDSAEIPLKTDAPIKYRGLSRKEQSKFSILVDGTMSKSISLMNEWRNISPTAAKIIDSIAPPDLHLTMYDSKRGLRRPRSADSFHGEKANVIGNLMTGTVESQGFKGLNEIFQDLKPTWFPGVQQLVRYGGKRISAKNNLKLIRAVRGQREAPAGMLGKKVGEMKTLLAEADKYIKKVFPDHETIKNYFPQSWDQAIVRKNQDQFTRDLIDFLEQPKMNKHFVDRYGKFEVNGLAQEMTLNIIGEGRSLASNRVDAVLRDIKNMTGKENIGEIKALAKRASGVDHSRILRDLPLETFEKYMKNDAYEGLQFYLEETVNRVEWARRFGENNELLYKGLVDGIKEANAKGVDIEGFRVERVLRLAEAMQGVYKMGGHKGWIRFQRLWTNLLNAALLPLATVASLPEAALPLYNGGFRAYMKAMPPTIGSVMLMFGRAIKKDFRGTDKTRQMIIAEQIRKAGDVATMERMNALFQGDTSVLGNVVFRLNLLHYWTKWMNHLAVGTYDAMVRDYFKARVAGKKTGLVKGEEVRMERLMEHYGLDIAEGMAWARAGAPLKGPFFEKLKRGAHMFAEDSVLTPNPSTLPLWHANPNLMWLRHLKSFPTLIGNRVIAKWGTETYKGFHDQGMPVSGGRAGMYTLGTGMSLLLVADLSNDITDFIRYGDKGNPLYKEKYKNFSEREIKILRAVERAGMFGMGNFVFDSLFHSYTGTAGVFLGPAVAKGDALIAKALIGQGIIKQNPKGLARELVKMTPVLNVNTEIREEAIKVLEKFLRENTFMDKGSKWRKTR